MCFPRWSSRAIQALYYGLDKSNTAKYVEEFVPHLAKCFESAQANLLLPDENNVFLSEFFPSNQLD
jgi:hypothetical protein